MTNKRPKVKSTHITLDGDFEGLTFVARTNPKLRVLGDLTSGNFDRITAGLAEVILDWKNFTDEEGQPIPDLGKVAEEYKNGGDLSPVEVISELPLDLAMAMANALAAEVGRVRGN